ncbi:MAG: DUF1573 domain-containing protein [Bacteroidales bacterium]|nr:DUF1573 domain-containing protein [Bacteroidales bacterium]
MKNFLLLTVLLISAIISFSQEKTELPADSKKLPEIIFEKTVHNYGTIKKGGDGVCEFKFKNTGKTPLVLQSVKTSCGCTTPEWPKEPILKGKTGTIKVKYDTNRLGKFSKTVTILSNAKVPVIELRIEGIVETPGVEPKENLQIQNETKEKTEEKKKTETVNKKTEPIKIKTEPR